MKLFQTLKWCSKSLQLQLLLRRACVASTTTIPGQRSPKRSCRLFPAWEGARYRFVNNNKTKTAKNWRNYSTASIESRFPFLLLHFDEKWIWPEQQDIDGDEHFLGNSQRLWKLIRQDKKRVWKPKTLAQVSFMKLFWRKLTKIFREIKSL